MSKYNTKPKINVNNENCIIKGYDHIFKELTKSDRIAIECYPGTDYEKLKELLIKKFVDYKIIFVDEFVKKETLSKLDQYLTDDRIFGKICHYTISDFYDSIEINGEKYIIYGFGASLCRCDTLVMADLARWEIQLRLRNGMSNWQIENKDEDILRKYKRGFFVEWRVADKNKRDNFERFNYFLDLNNISNPKLISGNNVRQGLQKACKTPFRLVPFFDPGVWGGQWMKEKFSLDKNKQNYAWSFDGVPEENSIYLEYGKDYVELPAMNLVKYQPKQLLGEMVYGKFGDEFPIRFDLLDTIDGENLSLQVHPLTEYIQEQFGMNYTQDESYYILDVVEQKDPCVYVGVKNNTNKNEMFEDLRNAKKGDKSFDALKYVNKFSVKKHDHILIPAGTIHCSGAGTMVLEISATPYIFTFKLWDWGRLGMDGIPRPVHLNHGEKVIQMDRDTDFVKQNLINNFEQISNIETKTGLYKSQFIETRRFETEESVLHKTENNLQMLNLVEGSSAIISSPNNEFEDYQVNYAETFIIPASISEYVISPIKNEKIMYIKAYVRG